MDYLSDEITKKNLRNVDFSNDITVSYSVFKLNVLNLILQNFCYIMNFNVDDLSKDRYIFQFLKSDDNKVYVLIWTIRNPLTFNMFSMLGYILEVNNDGTGLLQNQRISTFQSYYEEYFHNCYVWENTEVFILNNNYKNYLNVREDLFQYHGYYDNNYNLIKTSRYICDKNNDDIVRNPNGAFHINFVKEDERMEFNIDNNVHNEVHFGTSDISTIDENILLDENYDFVDENTKMYFVMKYYQ